MNGTSASCIFSDDDIHALIAARPCSMEELRQVKHFTAKKCALHGDAIIDIFKNTVPSELSLLQLPPYAAPTSTPAKRHATAMPPPLEALNKGNKKPKLSQAAHAGIENEPNVVAEQPFSFNQMVLGCLTEIEIGKLLNAENAIDPLTAQRGAELHFTARLQAAQQMRNPDAW